MGFDKALVELKKGKLIAREGWNGKGMYIYLEELEDYEPFICMHTAAGNEQPGWLASQADLLAEDWFVVSK